jgi:hypothetical protein
MTQGYSGSDNANISNIVIGAGLMLGAGTQVDGSGNLIGRSASGRLDPSTN